MITNYFVIPSLHLNQTWLHLKQILSAMAKKMFYCPIKRFSLLRLTRIIVKKYLPVRNVFGQIYMQTMEADPSRRADMY